MGTIELSAAQGVATIAIDNPAQRNAMTLAMWESLGDIVGRLAQRPDIRVLLLRGVGDAAFVSGADIKEFETVRSDPRQTARYNAAIARAQGALADIEKPVIAAIGGICYGGGIGLAAACDLRHAAEDARFCMPAARLGLGYDARGMRRLVQVIGAARASELFFTARVFDGIEAVRIGFAHAAHPRDRLMDEAAELARRIAALAPLTLRAAKLAIRHVSGDPGIPADQVEDAVAACFRSEDYREGRRAFEQKRKPVFTGQ